MENLARHLERIRAYRPDLAHVTVQVSSEGQVNDVVIFGGEWVARFPKNDWARQRLAQEARILDLVRRHVSLPVPVFEHPADDFVMYRLLPGAALTQREILGQAERIQAQIVEQLAVFLRQLHAIPRSEVEQHGITTADSARGPAEWEAMFREAERELFPLLMADAREWVTDLFAPVLEGRLSLAHTPALIHGDLGPYHLLFDREQKRLNGVIDFGTGGLGDPADDFACLINGLGESFLRRMAKFYPEIEAAIDRARFMAGTLEVQWALGGLRTKDLSWFTVHLGRARDVRPMGAAWE